VRADYTRSASASVDAADLDDEQKAQDIAARAPSGGLSLAGMYMCSAGKTKGLGDPRQRTQQA
jgi:hypothetical protein